MLKLINLKKLTAKTLIGILVTGSLLTQAGTKTASAGQCDNNGHGNNGDIKITLSSDLEVLLEKFDPSNPGNSNKIEKVIKDSNPGISDENVQAAREIIELGEGNYDYEHKPTSGNDSDCDGINDELEVGGNFNKPVDTDGDGIPDFADNDSDGDGILDGNEATPALWGIDEDDGQLFLMGDYTDKTTMTNYGSLKWNNSGTIETIGSDMEAMTLDENGDMYIALDRKLTGSGNGSTLLKFNITDASTTADNVVEVLGVIGINFNSSSDNVSGLSINPNTGELVALLKNNGSSATDKLYIINKTDGSVVSEIGDITGLGEASTNAEDIEHAPDGTLYVTDNADDHIYKVNSLTGAIIEIVDNNQKDGLGSSSVKFEALGWDFANNRLIGFDDNDESLARLTIENGNNQKYYDTSSIGLTDVEGVDFVPTEDGLPTAFLDYDNDGVADTVGNVGDEDGNGIPDSVEIGIDPTNPIDSDNDGTPNYQDSDDDNNGINDVDEIGSDPDNPHNFDNNSDPDYMNLDDDGDGIPDSVEIGSNPDNPNDSDNDGNPDYQDTDSDGDGIPDVDEGSGDPDNDGVSNFLDTDSDGDTIPDAEEGLGDPDNDGISNFLDTDSDGDTIPDENEELADSNDPGKASDVKESKLPGGGTIENVDGDGEDNYLDEDSDDDGFKDDVDPEPYAPTYAD